MTKRNRLPKRAECQNPDHAFVHCAAGSGHPGHVPDERDGIRSSCWTTRSTTFAQQSGRHRPNLYCGDECARHVNKRFMKAGDRLVPKAATTFVTPAGETLDYNEAAKQVDKAAAVAGVPKRSGIRTAMLTELPTAPRGQMSMDGHRGERKVPERGLSAFQTVGQRENSTADGTVALSPGDPRAGQYAAELGTSGDDVASSRWEGENGADPVGAASEAEREQAAFLESLGALDPAFIRELTERPPTIDRVARLRVPHPEVYAVLMAHFFPGVRLGTETRDAIRRARAGRSGAASGWFEAVRADGHNSDWTRHFSLMRHLGRLVSSRLINPEGSRTADEQEQQP